MAKSTSPLLTLNNGVQMPALGLGVFQSSPEETTGAVESAIAQGYRLIDTAAAYFNERQVGEGLRRSNIRRDDVFLETKVWISDYGYDATQHAVDKSAGKLGVERIDLLLLHQPLSNRFDLTLDAYRALEKLLADGKVRAIGVSNFMASGSTTSSTQSLPTRSPALWRSPSASLRTWTSTRSSSDRGGRSSERNGMTKTHSGDDGAET